LKVMRKQILLFLLVSFLLYRFSFDANTVAKSVHTTIALFNEANTPALKNVRSWAKAALLPDEATTGTYLKINFYCAKINVA
jgi:hypothetical protein